MNEEEIKQLMVAVESLKAENAQLKAELEEAKKKLGETEMEIRDSEIEAMWQKLGRKDTEGKSLYRKLSRTEFHSIRDDMLKNFAGINPAGVPKELTRETAINGRNGTPLVSMKMPAGYEVNSDLVDLHSRAKSRAARDKLEFAEALVLIMNEG